MTLCKVVEVGRRIVGRTGRPPLYTVGDVVLLAAKLSEEGPVGRQLASRYLKLGERSARNLIERMRREGLVRKDPVAGAVLREEISSSIKASGQGVTLCERAPSYVICIRRALREPSVADVVRMRDALVRGWCEEPIIAYTLDGAELVIPGLPRDYPGYDAVRSRMAREAYSCRGCIGRGITVIALVKAPSFSVAKHGLGLLLERMCESGFLA